jgi:hypothetical protein
LLKRGQRATLLARGATPILRAGQPAQLYADRGIGKTLLTRSLALVMAGGGKVLGFHAPFASGVLYIDGEMASADIQKRDQLLADVLDLPRGWDSHNLVTVARDWQDQGLHRLDTEDGQMAIDDLVEWADVIIVDNRACLFDPEGEKDGTAWQPEQVGVAEGVVGLPRIGSSLSRRRSLTCRSSCSQVR